MGFREDGRRIHRDHAPVNFNTLCQFALNLMRCHPAPKGVKHRRFKAAVDDNFRTKVMFALR